MQIIDWHVHVYFDNSTQSTALEIYNRLSTEFCLDIGRMHERPIGPHTKPQFRVLLPIEDFDIVIPWMALNRQGLSVLVHPNTGDELADHRDYPIWMGEQIPLKLDIFT